MPHPEATLPRTYITVAPNGKATMSTNTDCWESEEQWRELCHQRFGTDTLRSERDVVGICHVAIEWIPVPSESD